tara:strand:+ start:78 stop:581 length:504 start_codon:yes stop_codon:yes gene_type:complete
MAGLKTQKRSFFDITDDIVSAKQDIFANEEDTEEKLSILFNELGRKEDGVYWFVKKIQQDIDLADEYIAKIQTEKKRRQGAIKSMKNMVIDASLSVGKLPEHSEFNPLKVMESASVEIIDENKIPEQYWIEVITKKLDKKRMLAEMKRGTKIPGADIARNPYVKGLK